jgi:short-subunit dehydrogenase
VTSLIFGASAGVGRALARRLAARGDSLVLVARDSRDLEAEAAHLRTTFGIAINWLTMDASSPQAVEQALRPLAELGGIRNLLFPVGMANDVDDGLIPADTSAAIVNANLTSVIGAVALFLPGLLQADRGNIVGFGSVAAIRGRGANVVYAAAKRGLESYFESVRHRTAKTGIRVQFYRLGYVDTQLSYGRKIPFPIATPEKVADHVVRNLDRDIGRVQYPAFWAGIAVLLRALPWIVYRRLQF